MRSKWFSSKVKVSQTRLTFKGLIVLNKAAGISEESGHCLINIYIKLFPASFTLLMSYRSLQVRVSGWWHPELFEL